MVFRTPVGYPLSVMSLISSHVMPVKCKKSVFVVHSLHSQDEGHIHPGVAPQTENLRAALMASRFFRELLVLGSWRTLRASAW